jgi:hypothetical protein
MFCRFANRCGCVAVPFMQTFQVGLDSAVVDPFVLSISKKLAFNELAKEFPELVRSALIMSFLGLDGRYLVTILTVVLP